MKKTRVLVDTFHLLNALTGIRTYTTELCKGLENIESESVEYVFLPNWKSIDRFNGLRGRVGIIRKIINHLLYFSWKQLILPLIVLFRRIDVIIAPDYMLPFFKFGAIGIPVFHDTFYWELKKSYNPLWRRYFLFFVRLGLNQKSRIVATTNYVKGKIASVVSNQYPISVVYQCPKEFNQPVEASEEVKMVNAISEGKAYFLHVGVFDKRKNLVILVEAFALYLKENPDSEHLLILVGSRAVTSFHDSWKEVNERIMELDLKGRVRLPGFVNEITLSALYSNAHAYIFPSIEEGFGIPVLEAMKSGVPVIISDQGALLEVSGGFALVFSASDPEDLCRKMVELSSSSFRASLIENGSKRARMFNQRNFARDFNREIIDHVKNV